MNGFRCLFRVFGMLLAYTLANGSNALASDLGRLFTTPEQRLQIDAMRNGDSDSGVAEASDATGSDQLTLNGILRGSNGRQRVWINGEGLSPTGADTPATLLYDGRVRLQWRGGGSSATLKPGQTLDKTTGTVFEAYSAPLSETEPPGKE